MGQSSGIGVLDKAVGVLRAAAVEPCGLSELCARTGLPRATAHRLAVGLEVHGLLHRGADGRWRPGPALAELAHRGVDPLLEAAAAVLPRLRDITGESVQLYRRDGTQRVCVAAAEPASGLRDTVPVGSRLPMTAGSGAKVLAAWADPATQRALLPEATFTERALLDVRRRGWAQSVAEREAGVASVSAPVRDAAGTWWRRCRSRARWTGSADGPACGGRRTCWRRRTRCSTGFTSAQPLVSQKKKIGVPQRQRDVVQALEQAPARVVVNLERHREVRGLHGLRAKVDGHLGARLVLQQLPQQLDVRLGDLAASSPPFPELPRKMSANREEMTTRKP